MNFNALASIWLLLSLLGSSPSQATTLETTSPAASFQALADMVYSDLLRFLALPPAADAAMAKRIQGRLPVLQSFLTHQQVRFVPSPRNSQGQPVTARAFFMTTPLAQPLDQETWASDDVHAHATDDLTILVPARAGAWWQSLTIGAHGEAALVALSAPNGTAQNFQAVCENMPGKDGWRKLLCRHERLVGPVFDADLLIPAEDTLDAHADRPTEPAVAHLRAAYQERALELDESAWRQWFNSGDMSQVQLKKLVLHEFFRVMDIDDDNAVATRIFQTFPRAHAPVWVKGGARFFYPVDAMAVSEKGFHDLTYSNNVPMALDPQGNAARGYILGWWSVKDQTFALVVLNSGQSPNGLWRRLYGDGGSFFYKETLQPLGTSYRFYVNLADVTEIQEVKP